MLKFEFKKLFMRKTFLGMAVFLLICQCVLIWNLETPKAEMLKNVPESVTSEDVRKFESFSDYLVGIKIDPNISSEEYFFDEAFLDSYYNYSENDYKPLIIERENYRKSINGYNSYVEKVIETSKTQGLEKINRHYSKLNNLDLKPVNYHAVEAFIRNSTPQLFILLFAIFLGVNVASTDIENTDFNLTNVKGDKRLSIIKILTSVLSILFFSFVSNGLTWIISTRIYGNVSLLSSIQAFPSLMQSPFSLSVFEWLSVVILWNSLAGIVVVLLTLLTFRITKQAIITSGVIWALLALLYQVAHSKSILSWFRYLNPINLLESSLIFSRFNTPFFGLLENQIVLIVGLTTSTFLVVLFISLPQKREKKTSCMIKTKMFNHTSMTKHTVQKLFINHKAFVVFLLLALTISINSYKLLTNSYTPEFKDMISREHQIFEKYTMEELKEQVGVYESESKEINISLQQGGDEKKIAESLILYEKNQSSRRTANKVLNYMNLGHEVHPSGYEVIMSKHNQKNDIFMALITVISVVLILAPLFASDDENNDTNLYKTTPNYRRQFFSILAVGLVLVLIIFLVVFASQSLIVSDFFYFDNTTVDNFLWENSRFSTSKSAKYYMLMLYISKLVGINLVFLITFIMAKLTKSTGQTILASLAFILGPFTIGVSLKISTVYITVFDLLLGNWFLNKSTWFQKMPIIVSVFVILLLISNIKKPIKNN